MHNVSYWFKAKRDLKEIKQFIAQDNIFYARKVVETIVWFANVNLSLFPLLWKEVSSSAHLREVVEPTFRYRIVYSFDWIQVHIVSIFKYKDF